MIFKKKKPDNISKLTFVNIEPDFKAKNLYEYINKNKATILQKELSDNTWTLADDEVLKLKDKIEKAGTPLKEWNIKIYRGIITGFNEAFIIDTETRDNILEACENTEERNKTEEIIKPILRGRDIDRYYYKWAGLWIILIKSGWTKQLSEYNKSYDPENFFKDTHPSLYNHLISFIEKKGKGKGLLNRDDRGDFWWELRDCAYYDEFEKEKIVWQEIVREPSFTFDNTGIYCEATTFIMTGKNLRYFVGLLNSKPITFFFKNYYAGGGLGEDGYRYKKAFLEQLPIPPITQSNQHIANEIEDIVNQILGLKKQNSDAEVYNFSNKIDELVYKLYDLTAEEIKIIEGITDNH